MIFLDTNFLITSFDHGTREDQQMRRWLSTGEILKINAIAWAEFLCGPRQA